MRFARALLSLIITSLLIVACAAAPLALAQRASSAKSAHKTKGKGHKHKSKAHKKAKKKKKHAGTSPKPAGKSLTITSGTMTFTLTPAVASTFAGATDFGKAAPLVFKASSPATEPATNSASFPISGGTLNSVTGYGSVTATGGFTLTDKFPSIFGGETIGTFTFAEPVLATLAAAQSGITATVNEGPGAELVTLNLSGIKATVSGSTITLANIPADLTKPAVGVFSGFPGVALTEGEEFAKVTIQATT